MMELAENGCIMAKIMDESFGLNKKRNDRSVVYGLYRIELYVIFLSTRLNMMSSTIWPSRMSARAARRAPQ